MLTNSRGRTTVVFTIVSANYGARARVLMQDVACHHPGARRVVFLLGAPTAYFPAEENFEVIPLSRANFLPLQEMEKRYGLLELATAVKPWCMLELMRRGGMEVMYLDPDISIYQPLGEPLRLLRQGASSVLLPHRTKPQAHLEWPSDQALLQVGAYNLGFFAARKCPQTLEALQWWADRLRSLCKIDLPNGLFTDQKWMDLWPSYCEGTAILRDEGLDVAYWNIDTRPISRNGKQWFAGNVPLVFFHFSGLEAEGHRLSKFRPSLILAPDQAITELVAEYRQRLNAFGHAMLNGAEERVVPWRPEPKPLPIAKRLKHLIAEPEALLQIDHLRVMFSGLFDPEYYLLRNPDVAEQLPNRPLFHFMRWGAREGRAASAVFDTSWYLEANPEAAEHPNPMLHHLRRRRWWKKPSPTWRPERPARMAAPGGDICVITPARAEMGIGQAGRNMIGALLAAGRKVDVINHNPGNFQREQDTSYATIEVGRSSSAVNLFCLNVDSLAFASRKTGPVCHPQAYRILRPFWELEELPGVWMEALRSVDEIWAPSRYVEKVFAQTGLPTQLMPQAVVVDPGVAADKAHFGLPEGCFVFLTYFDFASYMSRKNPEAVIRAFQDAFPPGQEEVRLVVKAHGVQSNHAGREALRSLVEGDPRIHVIDATLDRREVLRLVASCDCFVSLHRSEGFGFGPAEAMAYGKPVVATAYGGVTDFLDESTGFPVEYDRVVVTPKDYYHGSGHWAEPRHDHAVARLREAFTNREMGTRRGAEGKRRMEADFSPEAVGKLMDARLRSLNL